MEERLNTSISGLKNSYSILFFSQNKTFGLFILIASFTTFQIGIFGLLSTIVAIFASHFFKQSNEDIKSGILTFNSTLIGFGVGAFFYPNGWVYLSVIPFSLLAFFVTVVLKEKFGRFSLPFLSLPFSLVLWTFLVAHFQIFNILSPVQKADPRYFTLLILGSPISFFDGLLSNNPDFIYLWSFFKAIGFITFNSSVVTGVIIVIGMFIHSRLSVVLSIFGAALSFIICQMLNIPLDSLDGILLTSNIIFTFLAIGGFFLITSYSSILWSFVASIGLFLLYFAIKMIIAPLTLPILFVPFCINTSLFISFFYAVSRTKNMNFPNVQHYSPEKNIYYTISEKMNYDKNRGYLFSLPFLGDWFISQGYNGTHTYWGIQQSIGFHNN